ncbi:MAG: hypothetical protein QXU82_00720 [Candidatus Aenigmatarchaeota archaeon]
MGMDKWEILAYVFAVLNPVLAGLLMGVALYTDSSRKYRRTGTYVIVLSLIMTALYLTGIARLGVVKVP